MADSSNEAVFSPPTLMLGEIHWHILRASQLMDEKTVVETRANDGRLIVHQEYTEFGREVGQDEIDWWVFRKEHDIQELRERTSQARDAAERLTKASELLDSGGRPETYDGLLQILRRFAEEQAAEINKLHDYVLWLSARDVLAPKILFTYRVWGSTRMGNREITFDRSEPPNANEVKRLTEIVLGLTSSSGLPVFFKAKYEIGAEMWEQAYDEESANFTIPVSRIVKRASAMAFDECAEYFELIRDSLRNILLDVGKFIEQRNLVNDDAFWRAFIEKVTQTPKAESQLWDFKETLTMWRVNKEPDRGQAKVAFCEDVASFANASGGVLIIGVTDKREIVGIGRGRELDNKLKFAADVLAKHLEYPREICRFRQIVVSGKDGADRVCLVVVIAQACEDVGVHDGAGLYSYPVRRETGLTRVARNDILRSKEHVKNDNHDFLDELDKFVHRPADQRNPARPTWPQQLGVYTASSSETIPAFPSELGGYRFQVGKDFWGRPFSEKGTIRVFQGSGWQGIPKFPATMNGCSSGVFMIRWRSAHPDSPVESSVRSYNAVVAEDTKPAHGFGYMSGTNCDQPMFKFPDEPNRHGGTLVDVYYELKFWQAAL